MLILCCGSITHTYFYVSGCQHDKLRKHSSTIFQDLKILNTNFQCISAIEMYCVENLFCVVLGVGLQ
jgi:hypothetical protein